MKRLRFAVPAAVVGLGLAGCVIPVGGAEVGDLRVTWSFDGSQVCEKVGVDNVTIQLIEKGKEGKDGAKAFGQTAECIAGSMVLTDVVAGTYTMTAVGTGEVAVFDNGEGITIDVIANQQTDASAPLSLANGEVVSRIEFQYNFNGEPVCSRADVATINAQVVDENGVAIAGSNTDCIAGLAVVEGIRVGEHTLQVEAADGDGNVRFSTSKALLGLQPGETLRLDPLTLTPALTDVTISFNFGGASCSQAGVDNVDVQILDGNRVMAAQNVQCIDGRAVFTDMPLSRKNAEGAFIPYTVLVDALDGNDDVLFAAEDVELVLDGEDDENDDEVGDDITVELEAKRATVTIPFKFPDNASCADVGVQNVDIQLVDEDGNATGTNVACIAGDSGPLTVKPGSYELRIDAISGEDVAFNFVGNKTVEGGDNVLAPIALEAQRSTVEVSWKFNVLTDTIGDVGGAIPNVTTSCITADVDTVIVRIFRGAILEIAQAVDCDEGRVEMPGIGVGNVRVEIEGIREQDGDAPFFLDTPNVVVDGARTARNFTLQPALAFVLIVWAGDCGVANAATVDAQIEAGGINAGINMPCAQGSQKLALPPGSQLSPVTIRLRGVDGQGVPDPTDVETIGPVDVINGINIFRFAGPT